MRMRPAREERNSPALSAGAEHRSRLARFLESAKDADAPRQGGKELSSPFGGRLKPQPSCAVFRSPKDADAGF